MSTHMALELSDLWHGDLVRSSRSGVKGRFEGIHVSGKARVNIGGRIILVPARFLERAKEEEKSFPEELFVQDPVPVTPASSYRGSELDLHIEVLRPDLKNALPERIVDIQLTAFSDFLEKAKQEGRKQLLVIHGRGKGVLRTHIHSILSADRDVFRFRLVHQDGATEILFY